MAMVKSVVLPLGHPAQQYGYRPGRSLIIGDFTAGETVNKEFDF